MLKKRTIKQIKAEKRNVYFIYYTILNIRKRCQPGRGSFRLWCALSVAEHYKFWNPGQRKIARQEVSELHNEEIKFRKL